MLVDDYSNFYSTLAPFYDRISQAKDPYLSRLSILDTFSRGAEERVLELGVGTGNVAIEIAKRGHVVTGIDVSKSMLNQARIRCSGSQCINLIEANAISFTARERFDILLSCGGPLVAICEKDNKKSLTKIHSYLLSPGDLRRMLQSVSRLLTSDGHFVIAIQREDPISEELKLDSKLSYSYEKVQTNSRVILKTHKVKMANKVICEETYKLYCYELEEMRLLFLKAGLDVNIQLSPDKQFVIFIRRGQGIFQMGAFQKWRESQTS